MKKHTFSLFLLAYLLMPTAKAQPNYHIDNDDIFWQMGFGCSPFGEPSAACLHMTKYVNEQRVEELIKWTQSPKTELRIFGSLGLVLIKKQGGSVPTTALQEIGVVISNSDGSMSICIDCDMENYDTTGLINDDSIRKMQHILKERGYLN